MPKSWKAHQAKKFARELELGRTYYVVLKIAQNMSPYEDSHLYSEYVFTDHLPFTGTPCTDSGYSAVTLCQTFGPVYDAAPRRMRNVAGPGPQVGAPLGSNDYRGVLDEAEIRGLEKHVKSGSDPATRQGLAPRKRNSWW